jgi:hypothetical protein
VYGSCPSSSCRREKSWSLLHCSFFTIRTM